PLPHGDRAGAAVRIRGGDRPSQRLLARHGGRGCRADDVPRGDKVVARLRCVPRSALLLAADEGPPDERRPADPGDLGELGRVRWRARQHGRRQGPAHRQPGAPQSAQAAIGAKVSGELRRSEREPGAAFGIPRARSMIYWDYNATTPLGPELAAALAKS